MKGIFYFILNLIIINVGFAQNGKLISKEVIDITNTQVWNRVSENNALKPDFIHLEKIRFILCRTI